MRPVLCPYAGRDIGVVRQDRELSVPVVSHYIAIAASMGLGVGTGEERYAGRVSSGFMEELHGKFP